MRTSQCVKHVSRGLVRAKEIRTVKTKSPERSCPGQAKDGNAAWFSFATGLLTGELGGMLDSQRSDGQRARASQTDSNSPDFL